MTRRSSELKSTGYEIFIGMLSLLSIVNLVLIYAFLEDGSLQDILQVMNAFLSGVFMIDFVYRLVTASSRANYFFRQFGWADLVASMPLPQFKVLRVFRLFRVIRLLRDLGPKTVFRSLIDDRAGSALFTLLMAGILVLEFGSLSVLRFEQYATGGNIKTASGALWYTIVTISTVGYGDQYPVTGAGRLVGALIIVVGVGIFGTFTGYLANYFLAPARKRATTAPEPTPVSAQSTLEQLKLLMAQQLAEVERIEALLSERAE
jgi:voltage-gated potassium channel Kch